MSTGADGRLLRPAAWVAVEGDVVAAEGRVVVAEGRTSVAMAVPATNCPAVTTVTA